ncbi:MAG: D-2-hydroxyacid dehydrogenase [Pseudomonadota bacterium]
MRILVVHDEAGPYLGSLIRRFPTAEFHSIEKHSMLPAVLPDLKPTVVLSFKEVETVPDDMAPLLEAPSIQWLHVASVGTEHIPSGKGGPLISHVAGIGAPAMAEYAVGALLAANLRLPDYFRQQARREWKILPWRSVRGRTILVIGLGWIGKEIAQTAKALGMRVIGIRSTRQPVANVDDVRTLEHLNDSLREADFVSLQIPVTPQTTRLIDKAALAAMKPQAWLVNVGRGALVDEDALVEALRAGRIAGAVLDVFSEEPLPASSPLWDMGNCIITPHSSGWTLDWQAGAYEEFAVNLERWMSGQPPLRVLDRQHRSASRQ